MAYRDFTITQLKESFGLELREDQPVFAEVHEEALPEYLINTLRRYLPLALNINTEKVRSELLIAPLLTEFKLLHKDVVSLFSGVEFNIDEKKGLKGRCDFLLCRHPEQLAITAPVCMAVEAKNENITAGIPQCLAEMVAAAIFNQQHQTDVKKLYGIVTTGMSWRFLSLEGSIATIDITEYSIQRPEIIFGLLNEMIHEGT